jgi:large subunit ribosomal protein L14
MIQIGSTLKVVDNSGAKYAKCIRIVDSGYKQRVALVGSQLLVSIRATKSSKKVKKGEIHKALLLKTKRKNSLINKTYKNYNINAIVLLNKKNNKLFASRIFSTIPKQLRYSRFLRLTILGFGFSL